MWAQIVLTSAISRRYKEVGFMNECTDKMYIDLVIKLRQYKNKLNVTDTLRLEKVFSAPLVLPINCDTHLKIFRSAYRIALTLRTAAQITKLQQT